MRWPLLAVLAVGGFVLGYLGFARYFDSVGTDKSGSDLVYLTLQLYVLESGSIPTTGAPWQLEIARLATAASSATAVAAAVAVAFRDQLTDWRLRLRRNHFVVCGLGEAGAQLARSLLAAGHRVVAVERSGQNSAVAALRRRGAEVIVGDPTDRETLRRTHLDRAGHLLCLLDSDDANAEVVLQAEELVAGRTGPALGCLAHIRDAELCVLMRAEELAGTHFSGMRVDYFSLDELAARRMIEDYPPMPAGPSSPGVLVVGDSGLAQALVAALAHRCWLSDERRSITITLVEPQATRTIDRLRARLPLLDEAAVVVPVDADLDPLDVQAVDHDACHVAYVCIDDDSRALQAALRARSVLADPAATVVVEVAGATSVARLADHASPTGRIHSFSLLDRVMTPEIVLGATYERLARAIHEEYLAEQRRGGATAATNASMVPWEELPSTLKESNRDQAAHIGTKLAAVGRGIAPLTSWDIPTDVFTDVEVELLAEMEHERWARQRRSNGWTPGPKDVDAMTTPYLVDWDVLSEDVRELDRQAVRGIPRFLARAGFQIV